MYSWPTEPQGWTINQKLVAVLSIAFTIYWLWLVYILTHDDEWHLWYTGLTWVGVLSVNHFRFLAPYIYQHAAAATNAACVRAAALKACLFNAGLMSCLLMGYLLMSCLLLGYLLAFMGR